MVGCRLYLATTNEHEENKKIPVFGVEDGGHIPESLHRSDAIRYVTPFSGDAIRISVQISLVAYPSQNGVVAFPAPN